MGSSEPLPGQNKREVIKYWNNINKCHEDKRNYRGIELSNHMKILLISDPETEKSAVALDVKVGSLNDPTEVPGLAHFCEHMLFLGTVKYPDSNGFSKYITEHGGHNNATTLLDHTVYFFDITPEFLRGALDSKGDIIITILLLMDLGGEDAFYENLTLGLIKVLENISGIQNIELDKRPPCDRMQLTTWEQRNCCNLPNDMRQFYLSADGFKLTWKFEYAGEILPIGNLKINSIGELRRLGGVKSQGDSDSPSLLDIELCNPKDDTNKPHFGVKCKIFEIDSCQGNGRVCLVYIDKNETDIEKRERPKIWLLDRSFEWHFLADTFTQYFRMMLVHMGISQWQFRFTPMGLTPFTEQMMIIIAPHLLQSNLSTSEWPPTSVTPFNHIDPSIFRTNRAKSTKRKDIKSPTS